MAAEFVYCALRAESLYLWWWCSLVRTL
jgi:hypothetical protein